MKKVILGSVMLLSLIALAGCSSEKTTESKKPAENTMATEQTTAEVSKSSALEHYNDLIDLAISVQKWLNHPKDTGTTVAIDATGEFLLVTLPLDLSTASEEAILSTAESLKEIRNSTYEAAKLTKEELPKPLLKVLDKNNVTYVTELEDGTLDFEKP